METIALSEEALRLHMFTYFAYGDHASLSSRPPQTMARLSQNTTGFCSPTGKRIIRSCPSTGPKALISITCQPGRARDGRRQARHHLHGELGGPLPHYRLPGQVNLRFLAYKEAFALRVVLLICVVRAKRATCSD
jgi:hypothetical protein